MVDGVNANKIAQMNQKYDKKSITVGETKVQLNIFTGDMAVTSDVKNFLGIFDSDKNNKVSDSEVAVLKKVLSDYAGSDKKLSDEELAKIFQTEINTPEFAKIKENLNTLINRQQNGNTQTVETTSDGRKITSNINSNGSGTQIIESKDENGNPVKTTINYGPGNVKLSQVLENDKGKITSEYTYNENDQPSIIKTTTQDRNGGIRNTTEQKLEYDANGKITKSETKAMKSNGTLASSTVINYNRDENGKLQGTTRTTRSGKNNISITKTTIDPSTGKTLSITTNSGTFIEDGKKMKITSNSETKFEYNTAGKLVKQTETGKRAEKPYSTETLYEADGKTIKSQTRKAYVRGQYVESFFDGKNLKNRTAGNLPTESIAYEDDGKTIKEKVINKFDENGVFIGRETYDKDGNLKARKDFSKPDGHIDTAYQIGLGDCYLLSSINSLAQTETGQKILQQNLQEIKDEQGNITGYKVTLPGVAQARQELLNGTASSKIGKLPEDKVHLTGEYTISIEEFNEAQLKAGAKYSAGDKDVLLLELGYEKYRDEAERTVTDNNIKPSDVALVPGLDTNLGGNHDFEQDNILSSGNGKVSLFILTGQKPESYFAKNGKAPTCYVDSNYNMHLSESTSSAEGKSQVTEPTNSAELDKFFDKLRQDYADGKLDNYAATAGFIVSTQEVNGQVINGGGHALTVVGVKDDKVLLSNPWSPEDTIEMSIADFKKSCTNFNMVSLSDTGDTNPASNSGTPTSNNPAQNNPTQNTTNNKSNYTVPKGKGYTAMIKEALISQGISPTPENIAKAKKQFEESNPNAIHTYHGPKKSWNGNKYLYANAKVHIPQFNMN